jgi:hypothetical protein
MAGTENRPFVGTWKARTNSVVKYTPDALVFINGDTSIPGCPRCRGRIEVQNFVTSMNVETGTTPGSHSASINLSLPRVQGQQVFIDGYNILRPGLEVHIFFRGYFPVRGMFAHLPNPNEAKANPDTAGAQQLDAIGSINYPNAGGSNRLDMSKYATYPYYPAFHGVVTQVSYDYADGFYTGVLQCASLLHFWQYQNITTAGAWLAKNRPNNDPGRPTMYGHNFNNVHPFSIIYTLHRDIAGAAPGVDFALGESTNVDAVAAGTGEGGRQIFDMVSLYWEQRFKTRVQSLRMYGVNGQLFNAAQQAWLGSASTRDVNRLLPTGTYNDPEGTRTEQDPFSSRQSVAKALGLQNAGTDFVYSPLIQQDNELFNLSVLDMFAFNQAQAEIGNLNEWVSAYQTKLDIGNRVAEVTGYELYQDVDGDLVFKPPFYNLDTSTNRFYRLEDSDIISASFVEKEPVATYIIVKGVWIAGYTDVPPVVGATNKRGMYVDYKLVAKFGWRPAASLDLTYVTDPKVLFWIGVARLDLLNVATFSASATIPIRPELRPGYPVYIPFVDCYYYITQISHQFAFGGQCTTNLVLTCRRAKWHAPGKLEAAAPGESAIDKIHLGRPDLPPRPLEVFDTSLVGGREPTYIPRTVGFPNVVMALDPRKFDPNFSLVGMGIDWFDTTDAPADLLFAMLQRDVESLNAFEVTGRSGEDPADITRFKLRYGDNPEVIKEFTFDEVKAAFIDRQEHYGADGSLTENRRKQGELGRELAAATAQENSIGINQTLKGEATQADAQRVSKQAARDEAAAREFDLKRSASSVQSDLLAAIFEALQPTANRPIRRKLDGVAASDVKLSFFESLSHLKGQYMAATLPGQYRYFSCSHPNPEMQGMPIIEWSDERRAPNVAGAAAASRSRGGARGPRRRGGGGKRRTKAMLQGIEGMIGIPGFSDMAMGYIQIESRFGAATCNPDFTNKFNALFAGEAYRRPPDKDRERNAAGKRVDGGNNHSKKQAQKFLKNQARTWGDTDYGNDPKAWSECATGGLFQIATRTGMSQISAKSSKYRNVYPSDIVREPCLNTGLFLQKMYNQLRNPLWQGLPPEDQTFQNLRYLTGGGEGVLRGMISRGAAQKKWTPAEVREYLIQDDRKVAKQLALVKGQNAASSAVGFDIPASAQEEQKRLERAARQKEFGNARCRLRFKDPKTDKITFDVRHVSRTNAKFDRRRFPNTVGFSQTGKFIRGLCVSTGKSVEEATRFAMSRVPTDQWIEALEKGSTGNRRKADGFIDIACQAAGVDPLAAAAGLRGGEEDAPAPPAPAPATVDTGFGDAAGPLPGGVVKTTELSLDIARTVVQFQTKVKKPEKALRAPEAELGLGKCSKGIQIARGPQRTPQLTTTDQIQSIGFVRHKAIKNTQVIGTSVSAGRNTYQGLTITLNYKKIFQAAAEPFADNGKATVAQVYQDLYTETIDQIFDVPIPLFTNGDQVGTTNVVFDAFPEVVTIPLSTLPAALQGQFSTDPVQIADLTLDQLIQLNGYTPDGGRGETTSKYDRALNVLATKYAGAISRKIEAVFISTQARALEPTFGKLPRLAQLSFAFTTLLGKGGSIIDTVKGIGKSLIEEKQAKTGQKESPVHSPVFPVSDEKGYEHYGAYRYGRGLTIEPGGTFNFIHSGQDPFKNVTAQIAEEFLNIFTLVKQGRVSADSAKIGGFRDASFRIAADVFGTKQTPLEGEQQAVAEKLGLSQRQIEQVQQSLVDLSDIIAALSETAAGRDTVRAMLVGNGDNPDLITREGSFDITDTQFIRNYVNFAINYGKSAVFKTTVANAAFQLSDLTSHLLSRAGESCICRGSYSDIVLAAYGRDNFVDFDPETGVDREQKAEQFQRETIQSKLGSWIAQQQQYRGQVRQGPQPDAKAFHNAGGSQAVAVGGGSPLPTGGVGATPSADAGTVTPETLQPSPSPEEIAELGSIDLVEEGVFTEEEQALLEEQPPPIVPLEGEELQPLVEGDEPLPDLSDPGTDLPGVGEGLPGVNDEEDS